MIIQLKALCNKIATLFLFSCIIIPSSAWAEVEKLRVIWTDSPESKAIIAWDGVSTNDQVFKYGTIDEGSVPSAYPLTAPIDTTIFYKGMVNQFVRLENLLPKTVYYFVIQDDTGISQSFSFKTASDQSDDHISIISGGDSRNYLDARIRANKMVSKLRPDCVLFGGDMIASGTDAEWQAWFDHWQFTFGSDRRIFPIIPARGNHESSNAMICNLFGTPSEVTYALNIGGEKLRVYTLNTNISIAGDQTDWLTADLESNCSPQWKIAHYHKPMRPHVGAKSEGQTHYVFWSQLFYEQGMNLVIDCDSHTAKTTWPIKPSNAAANDEGFEIDMANGTIYAGEGCWGAPLRPNDDNKSWTRDSGSFNQFKWIWILDNHIETRTVMYDNIDATGDDAIEELTDQNRFTLPDNIDIWAPENGSVVEVHPMKLRTELQFPEDGAIYQNIGPVQMHAIGSVAANDIQSMDFFVNGNWVGSDLTEPFDFSWNPFANGTYTLHCEATNSDGLTRRSCPTEIKILNNPIVFISLNVGFAVHGNNTIKIQYRLSGEIQSHQIERSTNGWHFDPINELNDIQNPEEIVEYFDTAPGQSEEVYYRIKTIDTIGQISYSASKQIYIIDKDPSFKVFPNPNRTDTRIEFEIYTNIKENGTLRIFNSAGELISTSNIDLYRGLNEGAFERGLPTKGVYFFSLQLKDKMLNQKLLID